MKGRWTIDDLQKLANKGVSIEGINPSIPPALKAKSTKAFRQRPKALVEMEQILYMLGVKYLTEYQFMEARKYRFDVAIPEHLIGIEYEGLMSAKSRHTTIQGFSGDCTKYNLAVINGWRVLRYSVVNSKEFIHDIKQILNL